MGTNGKTKLLIVDDQTEVRRLVRMSLELGDYLISEADTGREALERVAAEDPDVVILDIMMPGELDGYEVCRQLRSQPQRAGLFICLLTARGQQTDIERGKALGADAYLIKPFSPSELIALVENAKNEREVAQG